MTMTHRLRGVLLGLLLLSGGLATASQAASSEGLTPFRSKGELIRFLKESQGRSGSSIPAPSPPPPPPPPVMAAPSVASPSVSADAPVGVSAMADSATSVEEVVTTASRAESITNTQEANVDEGGIVKAQGDILVVLRRGRLFTVSIAGGTMTPVDHINAYPPGSDGDGWYDEMLLVDGWVVIIGYSYEANGTELNRFRVSPQGKLTYVDSSYLRSDDYYSSENYASRLIGRKLIFYTPLPLWTWNEDPLDVLPGLGRRRRATEDDDRPEVTYRRIARAQDIYIAPAMKRDPQSIDTLHSITTCDVTAAVLDCTAIGVLGPESRSFYVSRNAIYLWVGDEWRDNRKDEEPTAQIFRIPFDEDETPAAVGVRGGPINQFSFREDPRDRVLNILVRSEGDGDRMWRSDFSDGTLALARIPLGAFGDGSREVAASHYRVLPPLPDESWSLTNRYVGEYLLYGVGNDWGEKEVDRGALWTVPLRGGDITSLRLPQAVDRIEITGRDAIVVGGDRNDDLVFTSVEITAGEKPRVGDRYIYRAASEGETRSHAFFYSPDRDSPEGDSGTLGLPVAREGRPAYQQLFENSAAMVFLRRDARRLSPAGELAAAQEGFVDDDCVASCADWYGNARPIFMRGRIFALMGYEMVEGRLTDRTIREIGRVSFAPPAPPAPKPDQ